MMKKPENIRITGIFLPLVVKCQALPHLWMNRKENVEDRR